MAGGRPRLIGTGDEAHVAATALTRSEKLGRPFTHWSLRKLAGYLADNPVRADFYWPVVAAVPPPGAIVW